MSDNKPSRRILKVTLPLLGGLGFSLFMALLILTFGVPELVEESARGFVKAQIEREIDEQYKESPLSSLEEKLGLVSGGLDREKEAIRENLRNNLPERIANVIAALCGYDCEKKKALKSAITLGYKERIADIQFAQAQLADLIKGKYMAIMSNLRTDLRIFLGCNAVLFGVLLLVLLRKPGAVAHLYVPGALLVASSVAASAFYIFGQNWFYTILYNDYMGFGYLAYVSAIFGFLMDVTFNRARITTEVVNGILNAFGSALSVAPC